MNTEIQNKLTEFRRTESQNSLLQNKHGFILQSSNRYEIKNKS
jgi:hypothetical protein